MARFRRKGRGRRRRKFASKRRGRRGSSKIKNPFRKRVGIRL